MFSAGPRRRPGLRAQLRALFNASSALPPEPLERPASDPESATGWLPAGSSMDELLVPESPGPAMTEVAEERAPEAAEPTWVSENSDTPAVLERDGAGYSEHRPSGSEGWVPVSDGPVDDRVDPAIEQDWAAAPGGVHADGDEQNLAAEGDEPAEDEPAEPNAAPTEDPAVAEDNELGHDAEAATWIAAAGSLPEVTAADRYDEPDAVDEPPHDALADDQTMLAPQEAVDNGVQGDQPEPTLVYPASSPEPVAVHGGMASASELRSTPRWRRLRPVLLAVVAILVFAIGVVAAVLARNGGSSRVASHSSTSKAPTTSATHTSPVVQHPRPRPHMTQTATTPTPAIAPIHRAPTYTPPVTPSPYAHPTPSASTPTYSPPPPPPPPPATTTSQHHTPPPSGHKKKP